MKITQRPHTRKFHALSNLQDYILPSLRIKKSKDIIQILPNLKYGRKPIN